MREGHPEDRCAYAKFMKDASSKRYNSVLEIKAVCVTLFRTMHMCTCRSDVTNLMHATFRRDRKRHVKRFIVPDATSEFGLVRAGFLATLLDHFMLTKYHS